MDDATKKMLVTIVTPILRKGLITAGASLSTHGIIASNQTETFVAAGMFLAGIGWSFWNDYGRAIVLSQLEVLKAKSLAQAAKLQQHDIAPVTVEQIAAKGPETMTPASVTKVTATLALAALIAMAAFASPAMAQLRKGPIATAIENKINGGGSGDVGSDLLGALEAKLLPDLKYALNVANGSGDTLTAPCWTAWIAMIEARQKANVDDQGKEIPMPDPALITKFQKLMDIRNALQPTSPFMRACSPVAGVVKSDIRKFIGLILTGGAGLAAMGIGL